MTDSGPNTQCDPTPPTARRITLKDGRYMIFFEFDEAEQPADPPDKDTDAPSSDKTDV